MAQKGFRMPRTPKAPRNCLHKGSGQANSLVDGNRRYLGKHNSPESRDEYDKLLTQLRREHNPDGRHSIPLTEIAVRIAEAS